MEDVMSARDDTFEIKKPEVETIVRKLSVTYNRFRFSFLKMEKAVDAALDAGDVTLAINVIIKVYQLPKDLIPKVGYSAKISSIAMLVTETDVIWNLASGSFNSKVRCKLLLRASKCELLGEPRYRLKHIIGHELSHARMAIDGYVYRDSEFVTDVLALLVTGNYKGYADHLVTATGQYGYIRSDIRGEVFRCLALYSERIYL